MENIKERKNILRQKIREQSKRFTEQYLHESSEKIKKHLLSLPAWQNAQTVFVFVSMGAEPNTHDILQIALESGKKVAVPRCLAGGIMETRQFFGFDGLEPKSFGILEPDDNAPIILPGQIELVVAPCVAAAENGYRLGNGGGYYDRFLDKVSCPVVCLCHARLLQKTVPTGKFDKAVDFVLTENGIFD